MGLTKEVPLSPTTTWQEILERVETRVSVNTWRGTSAQNVMGLSSQTATTSYLNNNQADDIPLHTFGGTQGRPTE